MRLFLYVIIYQEIGMGDRIVRAICNSGGIRVLACSVETLANEVCLLQKASPTSSVAMGRALAGGALMGALLKPDQRIALKFEGNGPMQKLIVEADYDGAVRATAGNPQADAEPINGKWNIPGIIGKAGFLTVTKDIGIGGEPYHGMVQLRSSEIGDDLAYYLSDSEQTPSAVGLGAALNDTYTVNSCGGFLVQALPRADVHEIDQVMQRITELPPLSTLLQEDGPEGVIREIFGTIPYTLLEGKELFFRCGCDRGKVERALLSIGPEEIASIRDHEGFTDVTCEFCRTSYHFNSQELDGLLRHNSDNSEA